MKNLKKKFKTRKAAEESAADPRGSRAVLRSPRGLILGALGVVTLGVAVLSMYATYGILTPRFGGWSIPTVGALDTLWLVFQATEVLAGNNARRAGRVRWAGLTLTAALAAIPTTDLIVNGGFDLAVVLTPIAIIATKIAWWVTLPALGRRVSTATATALATERQKVADQLEEMEAKASHRIELLQAAQDLEQRVAVAETDYRLSVLTMQQKMTEALHEQAQLTEQTMAQMPLPASVTAIELPELGTWSPVAPALTSVTPAVTPALPAVTQVNGESPVQPSHRDGTQEDTVTPGVTDTHQTGTDTEDSAFTLDELAAVAGVEVPRPGEQLDDAQLDVVLRHLRYREDPPASYRQAVAAFRARGFIGSEDRVRPAWRALTSNETNSKNKEEVEEETEDSDA